MVNYCSKENAEIPQKAFKVNKLWRFAYTVTVNIISTVTAIQDSVYPSFFLTSEVFEINSLWVARRVFNSQKK